MVHKKVFVAGEVSIHFKPTAISGIIRLSGKGRKAFEVHCQAGAMMCDHGQATPDDFIKYYEDLKKDLESEKHGN